VINDTWQASLAIHFLYIAALLQLLKTLSQPTSNWGPADSKNRTGKYAMIAPISVDIANTSEDHQQNLVSQMVNSPIQNNNSLTSKTSEDKHFVTSNNNQQLRHYSPTPYMLDNPGYDGDNEVVITSFKSDITSDVSIAM
jgi:hypothetical protein